MTGVTKSLTPFAAASGPFPQISQPVWPTGLKVCPLLVLQVSFAFQSKASSYFKVKGQLWLYLSANLNYSGCWKSSSCGAAVREDFSVWIFIFRRQSATAAHLRLAARLRKLLCCFFFLLLTPCSRVKDLFLREQEIRMSSIHFSNCLSLRWFHSMRVCQSSSLPLSSNVVPFSIQQALDFVFMGSWPHCAYEDGTYLIYVGPI